MFGGPLRSYDLVFNSKFIYKFLPSICVVRQIEKESVWRTRVVTYIARVYYSFLNDVVGAVVLVLFVCVCWRITWILVHFCAAYTSPIYSSGDLCFLWFMEFLYNFIALSEWVVCYVCIWLSILCNKQRLLVKLLSVCRRRVKTNSRYMLELS